MPSDIRERKGTFFTPTNLGAKKLGNILQKLWEKTTKMNIIIWDCAAGTSNLLVGLNNPERIHASTLDKADVETMKDLAKKQELKCA